MRRKRKTISVTVDLDLLEPGQAAVADGRVWSCSALVNQALRRHLADQEPPVVRDTSDRRTDVYDGGPDTGLESRSWARR